MVMGARRGVDFGTMMRRAREARGVSLRQIAAATKISVSALEALERNDISRLPGGIFGRAFVRSYAIEVGLDPEDTVRDFLEQFPQDSVTAGSPHVPQEDHEAIESDRRSAETALKLIAISVPIVGAILYFTLWARPRERFAEPEAAAAAAPAAAGSRAGEPLAFELLVTAPVMLAVDVDGVRGESRLVAPGERLAFRAERALSIVVSDAAAVQLTINGQRSIGLGPAGESRTVHIGRDNYGSFLAQR